MKELIKFEKDNCIPCTMVEEHLKRNAITATVYRPFEKDDDRKKAMEFGIMSVPVTILVEDGKEIRRSNGFKPEELNEMIEEVIGE